MADKSRSGSEPEIARFGDCGLRLFVASTQEGQALARRIRAGGDWREVVCGMAEILIVFDPCALTHAEAEAALALCLARTEADAPPLPRTHVITVRYGGDDGPDLETVCQTLGMTPDQLADWHTGQDWHVAMLGFTPGFAYLHAPGGPDVPRLSRPRQRVAAGSVGLGASQTGLYALAGPGGWPIIGCTDHRLFNAHGQTPFTLEPGDCVRFVRAEPAGST
jgi:allophanate hydrolase